jgi:hypothetical protein
VRDRRGGARDPVLIFGPVTQESEKRRDRKKIVGACRFGRGSFVAVLKQRAMRAMVACPLHGPRGDTTMRVMVIVKATKNSETGKMPTEQELAAMGNFNEELVKAGVMLAGDGLHPSSRGKRIVFSGGKKSVVDGPFAETKELIAGFWLWQVKSMEEAVEWARRCPDPMPGEDWQLEIRPLFEAEDFGAEYTPELRAQEERLRDLGAAGRAAERLAKS